MLQTMNTLAMLRYDKDGEKKLNGPAKRSGDSRTSNWRRHGPKKQEPIPGVKPLTTYFSSTSSITNNGKRSADDESNDTSSSDPMMRNIRFKNIDVPGLIEKVKTKQQQKDLTEFEAVQLAVLLIYFTDLQQGIPKKTILSTIARYRFLKEGAHKENVIRGWVRHYRDTETLMPDSKRGKHVKWASLMRDEDVKNKCIEFFRTTPLNSRSAVKLKEYYEDVIFPRSTGQLGRPTIGLTTCIRYLRLWGFDKRYHQQDVYYDGHEREDVVAYRKDWASRMMQFRTQMKDFEGENCDNVIMPMLQPDQVEIVLVTHDECYFNSNDDVKTL